MARLREGASGIIRGRLVYYLLALVPLLLVGAVLSADPYCPVESDVHSSSSAEQATPTTVPKRHALTVRNPSGNTFQFSVSSPGGPPYPSTVEVEWVAPNGANPTGVEYSHDQYVTERHSGYEGGMVVRWQLPVDPATGKTETVNLIHDTGWVSQNAFSARSAMYPEQDNVVIRNENPLERRAQTPGGATPGPQTVVAANYLRWRIEAALVPEEGQVMTAQLCRDQMALLQGGHAFLALRFPVIPALQSEFDPYRLPLVVDPSTPRLTLMDHDSWPAARVLSVPLELKPEQLGFLESQLPSAPGEHWLALGAVETPVVDCAAVHDVSVWFFEAELWLDFGGAPDAGLGAELPCYYCYEGQTPPGARLSAGVTSYQGWGITCLGPHYLTLSEGRPLLDIQDAYSGKLLQTETVAWRHALRNGGQAPVTASLALDSEAGLPWGLYAGNAQGPYQPLQPITGPIVLLPGPVMSTQVWAILAVPAGAPSGPETLTITATDVTDPANTSHTTDLLWVGGWVAPPGSTFRCVVPLITRR